MLSTAALGKLFGAALGRLGPVAFQKVVRLSKVDAAIKGAKVSNPAILKAMNDFEIVVGSYNGEFTESLDKFLREIEKSGLVTAMGEQAAIQKRCPFTREAFIKLHDLIIGDGNGNPEELYDKLSTSFEASMQHMINDSALALVMKSLSNEISSRIDAIDQKISYITLPVRSKEDCDEVFLNIQRISKGLLSNYKAI